jgi:hypothetical protein
MAIKTRIIPISLSAAISPLDPTFLCRKGPLRRVSVEKNQAIKMASTIVSTLGTIWEKSMMVARSEGPAINGIARGTIKGSPSGRFDLGLSIVGKRIFTPNKNRITPEASLTVLSEI